jgi:ribose transport system permease protein
VSIIVDPVQESSFEKPDRSQLWYRRLLANQQFLLLLVTIAIFVFFAFNRHVFASAGEFGNNVTNFCTLVLLGVGETYVIATGGIDLSVGSTVSLSGVVGAIAMTYLAMHSELLVLSVGTVVCIGVGILVGAVNSALIHYARLVPFVATLVTWGGGAGMCLVLTGGAPIGQNSGAIALTVPKIWIFSYPALIIIAITFVAGLFLHLSRFGRFTFAVGSNAFAARAVGINVKRQITSVYVLSGALAGITGMFVYMRLGSGAPTAGTGQELIAIAAVVIGGARLTGGSARLSGTVIAAWMITIVSSGLIFMNVSPNYNQVAVALLIATAATAQALRKSARQTS